MPKEEWGVKRVCPTTGKRFYDLNKNPIVSPYTGEVVDIESSRRKTTASLAQRAVAATPDEALETDDDLLEDDVEDDAEAGDDLLEDDDDDTVSLDEIADVSEKDDEP